MPEEWSRVVMVLLPKLGLPGKPSDLRPICLSSVVSKLFARLLPMRTAVAFRYTGYAQTMGEARQPRTMSGLFVGFFSLSVSGRLADGLWAAKSDVQKALDTLNRGVFLLERLRMKLGTGQLFNTWIAMFENTKAHFQTPGGESIL